MTKRVIFWRKVGFVAVSAVIFGIVLGLLTYCSSHFIRSLLNDPTFCSILVSIAGCFIGASAAFDKLQRAKKPLNEAKTQPSKLDLDA